MNLQIQAARKLYAEEGWEKTKARVQESLRRRWWESLSPHSRFIFTHKKLTRKESLLKSGRRKLSIKGAVVQWWTPRFVGQFFGSGKKKEGFPQVDNVFPLPTQVTGKKNAQLTRPTSPPPPLVFDVFENLGVMDKIRTRIVNASSFSDTASVASEDSGPKKKGRGERTSRDDLSVSSSVETGSSTGGASVNSLFNKVSFTSLEQGGIDKHFNFSMGIPGMLTI